MNTLQYLLSAFQGMLDGLHKAGYSLLTSDSTSVSSYLPPDILETAEAVVNSIVEVLSEGFAWASGFSHFSVEILYAILGLSLLLFLIRWKRGRDSDEPLEGWLHAVNVSLFLLLSLVEIFYVLAMGSKTIWFCMPDEVGWGWTILNFIVFAAVVYNQIMCYFNTLRDVQYNSYATFGWRWGLYSWPIALIAIIVSAFFFEPGVLFALLLLILAQVVQVVIIFKNVLPNGGLIQALLCTTVYLVGSIATVAILGHFLVLLVIVLIGYFVLMIFASGGDSKYCPNCGRVLTGNNVCNSCRLKWEF